MSESNERGVVLVGVDGSASSAAALKWAYNHAQLNGSRVRAVMAWELPYSPMAALAYDPSAFEQSAVDALRESLVEVLGENAADVEAEVVQGYPAEVMIQQSREVDLLVLGNRGHGGFVGMLVGSVSQHCVAHAHCPVVVIRG